VTPPTGSRALTVFGAGLVSDRYTGEIWVRGGVGAIGVSSSGDIHVVDVSNFASPREVAFFHVDGLRVYASDMLDGIWKLGPVLFPPD